MKQFDIAETLEALDSDETYEICGTNNNGYVYLFRSGQWTKIGKSGNVISSLEECQAGNPERVTIAHVIACENMHLSEVSLQDRFIAKRGIGDWFNLSDEELAEIKKITMCRPTH